MSKQQLPPNRALTVLGGLTIAYVWFIVLVVLREYYVFPWAEDDATRGQMIVWGAVPVASTVLMAVGLKLRSRSPRTALKLIVAGAVGPIVWFWMIWLYGPLMIATIAVAVNSTPRKPSPAMA